MVEGHDVYHGNKNILPIDFKVCGASAYWTPDHQYTRRLRQSKRGSNDISCMDCCNIKSIKQPLDPELILTSNDSMTADADGGTQS